MYLKILILLYLFGVFAKEDKEIYNREIKGTQLFKLSSFENMKNVVKSFFSDSISVLEKKRKQMKRAFYRFFNEAFYNIHPCTSRYSKNQDVESEISITDLIVRHGYHVETHTVVTSDGYILSVHRILPTPTIITNDRKIAILNHGLLGSSIDWIVLGPKKALPYLLSDAGYDVWLPNFRGNRYSRTHVTKLTDTADFWKFSWHEIGWFDIPAVIDYVRETTGEKAQINLIAYCMSGSALLVLLSSSQRYNALLKSVTLLAPLVYMDDVKGPLQYLAELYMQYKIHHNTSIPNESEFKVDELFDNSNLVQFCEDNEPVCNNPLLLLDDGKKYLDLRTKFYNNKPSGGSTNTIIHYLQLIKSGQFRMIDLGKFRNYAKYGNASPPTYQLFNVNVPLVLFNSIKDSLSTVADLSKLTSNFPGIINHVIKVDNFTHFDFIWAESATKLVYKPLIKQLQKL